MTKKRTLFISSLSTLAVCLGLCTLLAVFLLPAHIGVENDFAGEEISGVAYGDCPENAGLLFYDSSGRGAFIYLDFENILTRVCVFEENALSESEYLTWRVHYKFLVDETFAGKLADRLGGIDMSVNGENSRWFSVALTQFCQNDLTAEEITVISQSFFEKISNMGLSSEDFMFIIEESETKLSYSVCYDWIDRLPELFCNCIYS